MQKGKKQQRIENCSISGVKLLSHVVTHQCYHGPCVAVSTITKAGIRICSQELDVQKLLKLLNIMGSSHAVSNLLR
jgi:hypothetical protein